MKGKKISYSYFLLKITKVNANPLLLITFPIYPKFFIRCKEMEYAYFH